MIEDNGSQPVPTCAVTLVALPDGGGMSIQSHTEGVERTATHADLVFLAASLQQFVTSQAIVQTLAAAQSRVMPANVLPFRRPSC
jgi:hypothetical protein